ncbi:MAG: HAMP domain-containing protein, partial [Planctomycetota bacterium]
MDAIAPRNVTMTSSSPARSSSAVDLPSRDVGSPPSRRFQSGRVIALQDKLLLSVGSIMLASTIGGVFLIVTKTTQHLEQLAANGAIDAVQIRREVPELYREVGGYALAMIAIALPCLYLLVQRVFTPVRRLAIAAKNVTAGKFQTVDIRRGDALGVLADSFNEMVIRLEEQQRLTSEAHDKLRLGNATLEQKVAERTREIEAATHRLSSEIAEKEDFLRAVSHDLNAPLRNIDGM